MFPIVYYYSLKSTIIFENLNYIHTDFIIYITIEI